MAFVLTLTSLQVVHVFNADFHITARYATSVDMEQVPAGVTPPVCPIRPVKVGSASDHYGLRHVMSWVMLLLVRVVIFDLIDHYYSARKSAKALMAH